MPTNAAKSAQKAKAWVIFEHEVRELVKAFGYQAETTRPSHDYGVDVIAFNNRRKIVVQCKLYGSGSIGGNVISQLAGTRQLYEATNAICVTTSRFTKQAREIAERLDIQLLDRQKLILLCQERDLTIPSLTVLTSQDTAFPSFRPIDEVQATVGRAVESHFLICHDTVSRHHAFLERKGLHLLLWDCGSKNGTFVNNKPIMQPTAVNYGDKIRFGTVEIICELQ